MERIELNKHAKVLFLEYLNKPKQANVSISELLKDFEINAAARELKEKGFINCQFSTRGPVGIEITDFGRVYAKENPKLRNPIGTQLQFKLILIISIISLLMSTIAILC